MFQESRCEREHVGLQEAEACQMVRDFLVEPGGVMGHPKRFSNSVVMSLRERPPRPLAPAWLRISFLRSWHGG